MVEVKAQNAIAARIGKPQNKPTSWRAFVAHASVVAEENKKEPMHESLACILTDPKFQSLQIGVEKEIFECNITILIGSCRVFGQIPIPEKRKISLPADRFSAEGFRAFYACLTGAENIIPDHELLLDAMAVSEGLGAYGTYANTVACLNDKSKFDELRAFDSFWRARLNGLENVANTMLNRVSKSFLLILCTNKFREMQADDVVTLLKSSKLGVHCEMEVYYAVHLWLQYDYEERKQHMSRLFQAVRYNLMPKYALTALSQDLDKLQPELTAVLSPLVLGTLLNLHGDKWIAHCFNVENTSEERSYIFDPLCNYATETWKLCMAAFLEYLGVVKKTHHTYMKRVKYVRDNESSMDIAHKGMTEGEQGLPKASI